LLALERYQKGLAGRVGWANSPFGVHRDRKILSGKWDDCALKAIQAPIGSASLTTGRPARSATLLLQPFAQAIVEKILADRPV